MNLGEELEKLHPPRRFFWDRKFHTDPETGLPKLPEGCYWEVKDVRRLDSKLVLVLHTPTQGEHEGVIIPHYLTQGVEKQDVEFTARRIISRAIRMGEERALIGKYPPKKL